MPRSTQDPLSKPSPPPSSETKEAAWTAALCEFRRQSGKNRTNPVPKMIWSIAAAASIAALCVVLLTSKSDDPITDVNDSTLIPSIAELYLQGHELFDGQLQAVTISKDQVIWHLSESPATNIPPLSKSDNFITLAIHTEHAPIIRVAATPGKPIPIELHGRTHMFEFLSDAENNIIAFSDDICWTSGQTDSPLTKSNIHEIR